MDTQRVNVYRTAGENGEAVFYIEQYDETVKAWLTVGDAYADYDVAKAAVDLFNAREITRKMNQWGL